MPYVMPDALPRDRWRFLVPLTPVAKGRPRFTREGRTYTAPRTVAFEAAFRLAVASQLPDDWQPLADALYVQLRICRPWPTSLSAKRRSTALPVKRPDLDNYVKCLDALNGLLWVDDSQIVRLFAEKEYGASPGIELIVRPCRAS